MIGKQKKREINREGNLAACQLGSLCQFVQTEEARVAVEGQVTGDLTDHTYATGISLIRLLHMQTHLTLAVFLWLCFLCSEKSIKSEFYLS